MKYLLGIGYVNRPDLLYRAVQSIEPHWHNTIIIDNSEELELRTHSFPTMIRVIEPPVPLSFSQTMNLMYQKAITETYEVILFMHNDAEIDAIVSTTFLPYVQNLILTKQNWGAVLTSNASPPFIAFNVEAMRLVGEWDITFPRYFADQDYYWRLTLAGYPVMKTNHIVTHHNGGGTTFKSDPQLARLHNVTFPLYERYYVAKWGGKPHQELYTKPFNR
ncbi:glycosyltransferase family 2 protein [Paenibacillus guangzhouensis]|uniref:glycosyltransferase family 2 protein n=1 Tax=Paenibacillus guangzhouensis TaxID=1473112 RepID=UPI00126711E6|nr:glycosyltransferase family 2 protein [Paenibacillus guangzhouensis]